MCDENAFYAMKITTWNVNSLKARLPRVVEWLKAVSPDVCCLQETKLTDEAFMSEFKRPLEKSGYESAHYGQGGYNGVAVLSKAGITDIQNGFSVVDDAGEPVNDPDARIIWATCGKIRIASAYIPNGRELEHQHYFYKLNWFSWLREQVKAELKDKHTAGKYLAVVGDFNVAPEDIDVWDPKAFINSTHTSAKERKAWLEVISAGMVDIFRQKYSGIAGLYTYWDYQQLRFPKHQGMRIDHILTSKALAENLNWVTVDRNARKGEKPSDHAPLTAEFGI